jgi:secretion/DNA translocation related TadE-like protein
VRRDAIADDRGSAAVMLVPVLSLVLLMTLGVAAVGRVAAARATASAAADLSALAAARTGSCVTADEVAAANGATVLMCRIVGYDAVVRASIQVPVLLGRSVRVTADARAGPASG